MSKQPPARKRATPLVLTTTIVHRKVGPRGITTTVIESPTVWDMRCRRVRMPSNRLLPLPMHFPSKKPRRAA